MEKILQSLKSYIETNPFDSGSDDCATVLDQLSLAYANSHESDPPEIRGGFKELEEFLHTYRCAITTPSAIFAAVFAVNTNIKHLSTVCFTERI